MKLVLSELTVHEMEARQHSAHLAMELVRAWDSPQGTGMRTMSSQASVKRQYVYRTLCVMYSSLMPGRIKVPPEKDLETSPNGVKWLVRG